ncbi:MAG TPA: hypothetical protein ENN53_04575 [Candidatus Acetothermia bacterium]|nr:hypothetical protein [Candidatus Acetothermia bacterium]
MGRQAGDRLRAWLDVRNPGGALVIGFSGATRAGVGAGTVVLAEAIWGDGSGIPLDRALVARAREALPDAVVGAVATVARPAGPAEKARLGLEALAVDMESAHLGRELVRRGIPFLIVRIVLDELWEDVSGFPIRWAGRALACSRKLGRAAAALRPVVEAA